LVINVIFDKNINPNEKKRMIPVRQQHQPYASIVMPVHNYDMYIKEAIDSVLSQTMPDFEFIIINDGSTDKSSEIAHSYEDPRIHIIDFTENKGCYPARNYGMRLARGKYICVMDADDICLPERLASQCTFFEENTDIGLIGSAFRYMNEIRPVYRSINPEIIRLLLLRYCYLLHPTCMIRHTLVKRHDLYYDENFIFASDYAWQVKASSLFPVSNVNEVLLLYRRHEHQISNKESYKQGEFSNRIRKQQLISAGLNVEDEKYDVIIKFLTFGAIKKEGDDIIVKKFIEDFIAINKMKRYYSQDRLTAMLYLMMKNYKTENEKYKL
jgi:glycosyltransferase involved in cell wall biosynthesis